MVTTQAAVGDIVPPRDRGRYQGIFGAVFGLASVAGPLLGGFFTTNLSWRWIFYVNLPLGIAALVVLAVTLPARPERTRRAIDWAGAALLALGLSGVVLVTDLGGATLPWDSPVLLGFIVVAIVALIGFLLAERRAAEPVLPLVLFRTRPFTISATIGLIVGFALFGAITYMPLFLQVVKGMSPTTSGLQMLPQMGGMLFTSIAAGQLISRTGRYRIFPIVGTGVMTAGLFLLSRMTAATTTTTTVAILLLLGLGLGMVMQVLVIAAQNAVEYEHLGAATSGVILFRFVGGSLGTAALGAIFSAGLARELARLGRAGSLTVASGAAETLSPATLAALPAAERALYADAFTASLDTVFLVAAGVALLGVVLAWLMPERPLRVTVAAATAEDVGGDVGEAFAMPTDPDPLPQVLRGLRVVADRDVRRRQIEQVVARAGVELSPGAAWLLVRLEENPRVDLERLAAVRGIEAERLHRAVGELGTKGLVRALPPGDPGGCRWRLTEQGCDVLGRLVAARRAHLEEILAEWAPERHERIVSLLDQLARELVPDVRPAPPHPKNSRPEPATEGATG